eukprot:3870441-Pyramimonas_sp.AAC.1
MGRILRREVRMAKITKMLWTRAAYVRPPGRWPRALVDPGDAPWRRRLSCWQGAWQVPHIDLGGL